MNLDVLLRKVGGGGDLGLKGASATEAIRKVGN